MHGTESYIEGIRVMYCTHISCAQEGGASRGAEPEPKSKAEEPLFPRSLDRTKPLKKERKQKPF